MHEVRREVTRVAELVLAARVRQGHRQVVALGETEQDVLHRRARSLVRLQKGHGHVLGARRRVLQRRAAQREQLGVPAGSGVCREEGVRGYCSTWPLPKNGGDGPRVLPTKQYRRMVRSI